MRLNHFYICCKFPQHGAFDRDIKGNDYLDSHDMIYFLLKLIEGSRFEFQKMWKETVNLSKDVVKLNWDIWQILS